MSPEAGRSQQAAGAAGDEDRAAAQTAYAIPADSTAENRHHTDVNAWSYAVIATAAEATDATSGTSNTRRNELPRTGTAAANQPRR